MHCAWPKCKEGISVIYLDKPLCDKHWEKVASEDDATRFRSLKKIKLRVNTDGEITKI
jgi:hypothetical protein